MTGQGSGARGHRAAGGSAERFRVLVADTISAENLLPLSQDERFVLEVKAKPTPAELADALAETDAVLVRSATKITKESLARATRLKVIGRAGVGVDTIDVDAATEKGIAVLTAPAGNTIAAAELTLALLLAFVRRVPAADRSMRAGEWERSKFTGSELYGKTLGLVGAGRIGGEVARRAKAFGMTIIAFDPHLSAERAEDLEIGLVSLEEVLRGSDVVSLHAPMTEQTAGLIGAAQLAMMKPQAVLVNVARGGLVDEDALVAALKEKRIAGAAVDVYGAEPLPADHPLRKLDSVVLTPHLGASTAEAQRNVANEIAEAVRAALIEGDLSRAVNAPAIGGEEMRRIRPLLDLAERLGVLGSAISEGAVRAVEVRYAGASEQALRLVSAAAVAGLLREALGPKRVNLVSALHLAETRGLRVRRVRLAAQVDYSEYVELLIDGEGGMRRVAGALLAASHPRVVRLGDYHVDVVPRRTVVVMRNRDVPGVIGRVGTVLGEAGINIGEYHQARRDGAGGGEALAAISLDDRLPAGVIEALRRLPDVLDVRQAHLD